MTLSSRRRIVGGEEGAESSFIVDFLEDMALADLASSFHGGPRINGFEQSLYIRDAGEWISGALEDARGAVDPTHAEISAIVYVSLTMNSRSAR
jgi:hypothetical protein